MYSSPLISSIHRIHRLNQTLPVNDTLIERKMKGELDKLSLKYDHPFVISNKKYGGSFDFAFPEIKLAVECDGIYNHSRPKDILRDIRKTQFCSDNDWRLLRFTDQQIKKDLPSSIYAIMFYYYVRSHNLEPYKVNGSKDPKCQQGLIESICAKVRIRRMWNDWRVAEVDYEKIRKIHWDRYKTGYDEPEKEQRLFDKSIVALRIAMIRLGEVIEGMHNNWILYEILMQHKNMLHSQIDLLIRQRTKIPNNKNCI